MIKQSKRLPRYCMWCMHSKFANGKLFCGNDDIEEGGLLLEDFIESAAQDLDCQRFDWNIERPGVDWVVALWRAEDELEAIE